MQITINLNRFVEFYHAHVWEFRYFLIGLFLANVALFISRAIRNHKVSKKQELAAIVACVAMWPLLLFASALIFMGYCLVSLIKLFVDCEWTITNDK